MARALAFATLIVCAAAAVWYYRGAIHPAPPPADEVVDDGWLEALYSANPTEVEAATAQVKSIGLAALPAIHATFQDPAAPPERVKSALKACGILGPAAAPALGEVAEQLADPTLTAEAALALSFMGRGAFAPLRDALRSDDPVVRREALRSIGKLKERAPLDTRAVLPLLIKGTADADPGVRAVAATYLGIIQEGGPDVVQALIAALTDPEVDVRRASAAALGSFGDQAAVAVPALRKAAGDADPEVAREAGVSLVKLQTKKQP